MTIGLKRGSVQVVPYDSSWVNEYKSEKQRLLEMFGSKILAIEHIGSTSIPGLAAKPIIDINVAIVSLKDAAEFIPGLEKLGYEYMKNRWFEDRYFFPKGPSKFRTHHLNLVEQTNKSEWIDPILFKTYLTEHAEYMDAYATLKLELASKYKDDRDKYTKAKSEFVTIILEQARRR